MTRLGHPLQPLPAGRRGAESGGEADTVPQYLPFLGLSAKPEPWLDLGWAQAPGSFWSPALLSLREAQQPTLDSHCPAVHLEGN